MTEFNRRLKLIQVDWRGLHVMENEKFDTVNPDAGWCCYFQGRKLAKYTWASCPLLQTATWTLLQPLRNRRHEAADRVATSMMEAEGFWESNGHELLKQHEHHELTNIIATKLLYKLNTRDPQRVNNKVHGWATEVMCRKSWRGQGPYSRGWTYD